MTTDYFVAMADTGRQQPATRISFWREHVTQNHGSLDFAFADADHFVGQTRVQRRGPLQLVDFRSSAIAYTRHGADFDADGADDLRILLPTAGAIRVASAGTTARVVPGDAAVLSMRHGFRIEQDDRARALILSCPSMLWTAPLPPGLALTDLGAGSGAVVRAMMREASAKATSLDGSGFAAIMESAVGLLAHGVATNEDDLVVRARAVVEQHADDSAFAPQDLAHLLGQSLRGVQYGLSRVGTTPAGLIREVRLQRAAQRLRQASWARRTVSSIAHASGFGSLSAFNAAFRAAYSESPAEHRG